MSDVGEIMREFARSYRSDPATDPRAYLDRVEGTDREELRLLIEGFLTQAPRQGWDPDAFRGSIAERAVAAAGPPVETWRKLLPELREKARISRATLVSKLAEALGFAGEQERVAAYYHRMELGDLPPAGVSTTVLERLGEIVGASAERLREAGRASEAGLGGGGEVFARVGSPMAKQLAVDELADFDAPADRIEPPDELDLLFAGGD